MKTLAILVLVGSAAIVVAQQSMPAPSPPTDIAGFDEGADPDEPGRPVARLSVASGEVSVKRGDNNDWVAGALNAPLMEGDSISVAQQAAAEVQFDFAHFARMAGNTEIRLVQIAGEGGQGGAHRIELGRGLVTWRVLRDTNMAADIATPLAGVHPLGKASVRVEVGQDGLTHITVRHGEVEVQTARGMERVREGGTMIVRPVGGNVGNESETQIIAATAPDRWDTWSDQRDAYLLRAASPQYVSQDIYGAEDLDAYGQWSNDPQYGNVWSPSVAADWAPYRDGRWVWEDYYGWTWIDNQPWGWAPFHYGTWYQRAGYGWSWYPGPRTVRTWWRPAMVGFFGFGGGGSGFSVGLSFGNVGWVPLAPHERYRPWYGRRGFGGGGRAVVNNINITNVYRNARFGNGATMIGARDFERGNYRNRFAASPDQLRQASLVRGAGLTPTRDNLRFSDRTGSFTGPRNDLGRRSFFRGNRGGATTVTRTPFTQQQEAVRSRFNTGGGFNRGNDSPRNDNAQARPQSDSSQGWRRFGSPRQDREPQANPSNGGQRGFFRGQPVVPQTAPQSAPQNVPQNNVAPGAPAQQDNNRNFRQRSPESFGARRFGGNSGSIDMSQPVVRQRENQDQGRRFGGGFGTPAPRQAGPRPERQQPSAAPAPQSRPAPQQFSRPENRGGGGGGGFRGGGRPNNGGGGGGNRRGR